MVGLDGTQNDPFIKRPTGLKSPISDEHGFLYGCALGGWV
jgi:hypothetical protein